VESKSTEELTKFYTSLYHASFLPHAFNDVDGRYPSFAGGKTIEHIDGTYYADYSLWDTFRALHPLLSILYPKQTGDMMQSLILKYEQGGWLPIFPAWNSYTSEMIGDPCASLIADAYDKGIRNFDIDKAYEALIKNAFSTPAEYNDYKDGKGRRALKSYIQYGFIPLEDLVKEAYHKREQVSRTLEYAYDDFCVARFAEQLGKKDVSAKLYQRAQNYRSVFDPRIGYVQGRHSDGSFENKRPDKGQPFITEGNACQYSWYVPQDVYGLMECMGGREEYLLKLDSMFTQHRMWHGNEPSHHIGFMYNYAGEPWKTQKEVRNIMSTDYKLGANGLSGNDDSGQMSAWYIFASLGFYPVCPAGGYYVIGSPSFSKAEITMENGNKFIVIARDASPNNIYIQSAMLNGKPYTKNFILHSDIASGGLLEFVMGNKPNKQWGSMPTDCPPRLDR
jgi:predicted alpha-1,2-mannosidase